MGKIVRKTWDEVASSKISAERLAKLAELANRPDSEIDFSDIPPLTEEFWKNAIRNPYYKPVKQQVTVRIDADVLAWLRRKEPRGYQTRLNEVLRTVMLQDLRGKRKRA